MTKNPFNICTWDDHSDCQNCEVNNKLACKWDRNILKGFYAIGFPPVLIAMTGMAIVGFVTGIWWFLIGYVVYFQSMFACFEIRFLCSHCPYYSETSKTLHCLGNHGSPKLWKYHPEPMNRFEKFLMSYAVVGMIFFILPLSILGYGVGFVASQLQQYGLIALLGLIGVTFASLLSSITFVSVLKAFFCSQCVNFSCPLNKVPKNLVDAYLRKNPVMKEAWEKSGYSLD